MTKQEHINAAAEIWDDNAIRRWHLDAVVGIEVAEALGVSVREAKPIAAELRPTLRAWHEARIDEGDPVQTTERQYDLLGTLHEYGLDRDPDSILDGNGLYSWLERKYGGQQFLEPEERNVAAMLHLWTDDFYVHRVENSVEAA
jgi:hypothetical protein